MITRQLEKYNIQIGSITESLTKLLDGRKYEQIIVLVDSNTKVHCLPKIESCIPFYHSIEIEAGEAHKQIQTCQKIWDQMIDFKIDRQALMINLGGGVIGDMGGFCARTYKRGIDFLQIPTTLLSQVDASVGGKLGIDHQGIKNIVGLFHDPIAVLIDPSFLKTLSTRELRSGYAEIVKHGMIADLPLWNDTKAYAPDSVDWTHIIDRSVAVKQHVVEQDQLEGGLRKILNFGHTIGHAIETYYLDGHKHLLHGEAIAIGMICEAYLSTKITGLTTDQLDEITNHLLTIYGYSDISDLDLAKTLDYMTNDKKNVGSQISFSLLSDIGTCRWDQFADNDLIEASVQYYQSLR